jgi:hypothetical protein
LEWLLDRGLLSSVHGPYERCAENPFVEAAARFPRCLDDELEYASAFSYWHIRLLQVSAWRREDAAPLFSRVRPDLNPVLPQDSRPTARATALGVVFDAFPQPDDRTPWEQILEFKADPDTSRQLLALRRWVTNVGRQALSGAEVRQEIEWLLSEYNAHMRLHRMKSTTGALETIMTAAGETFENLAKLKFGSLAKSLFFLRRRRVQLLEAERLAPGRELMYLARVQERFRPIGVHGPSTRLST